ncbi:MAG: endonuclease MutS2 [Fusobacterium gastrosuis]|uniref:endonuclease MutS2 n=1 Tax=Fusobacterium gastrosuis TaxID=1755100 RepID=UPI002AA0138E|nr:endonuclease MutS2 [Fusobacteriaceae bacterium]MDY5794856.1 endonuclease MutS2 [Fusobacterium gastrosuis]
MNTHSNKILEFDKLKEKILENIVIEENREKIINLEPYKDLSILNNELKTVKDFMDLIEFDGGFENIGFKNICVLMDKIKLIGTYLDVEELWDINVNLRSIRVFKNKLDELGKYKHLREVIGNLPNLKSIEDILNKTIDVEKQIKDDASLDLRDIRLHKKTLNMNIKRKFEELFEESSLSNAFQDKIITERDGRMVTAVKYDFKGQIKGIEHDRSSSGQTVFIEPLSIVSLNNKMRELETKEKEEIRKILLRISELLRTNRDDIIFIGEKIIYLDILNAKSLYGVQNKCNIPSVSNREILSLEQARHPLIDKDKVVPLTFEIGKDYNILLITGPNTGGKTVALKTAGLLTLMALSGLPIPASENSKIGFFEDVFADIGDEQSIEQSLSSFSAHLKNIKDILENLTKNSLVLLDELGSGTDPIEGSAFAMSVIDYLLDSKCKAFITTHYSQVKAYGYNEPDIETASMEFNADTLSPTYRLLIGIPGESNALTIASRMGIPEIVISKARNYISEDNKKVEKMIENIKNKSQELDELRTKLSLAEEEAKQDRERAKQEMLMVEKQKNEIIKRAYEDAEKMMNEMRAKASALVEKIQKEENKKEDAQKLQKNLNMLSSALREQKNKAVEVVKSIKRKAEFKVGDRIFVKSINQFANVLKINETKESAHVQAGILKLEVPFDEIKIVEEKKEKVYNTHSHKKTPVKYEIDLRGKMVDEAIYELETYLDRATLNSYTEVYVIHGKGTGALREGILKYLKTCRYVKDFRIGGHGEGGLGCTVVSLK